MEIRLAAGPDDLEAVRGLCRAYRADLVAATADRPGMAERFYAADRFEALLDDLPRLHAGPGGAIYLGLDAGRPAGCGMILSLGGPPGGTTCEIKRVYVASGSRGTGLAAALVRFAMGDAAARGHARMVLDTMRPLVAAARLYERLGFAPCPPFRPVAEEEADYVLFYGRALGPGPD